MNILPCILGRLRAASLPLSLLLVPGLVAGCTGGTSGLITPGAANAEVLAFTITGAQGGPATITLTLRDDESDDLVVRFKYTVGGVVHDATMDGMPQELTLASSPAPGSTHVFQWTFAAEADLGPQLTKAVIVWASIEHLHEQPIPGTNAIELDLGNDPPVVVDADQDGFADGIVPAGEAVGTVDVQFTLKDSSADPVDVAVDYAIVDGLDLAGGQLPAPGDWHRATPAGAALIGVATNEVGLPVDFSWDAAADLPGSEHEVALRFSPDDNVVDGMGTPLGVGQPQLSDSFRIDNNAEPQAALDGSAVLDNGDRRRGIPVPFTVSDVEADQVHVVFQWRRASAPDFPPLPGEVADLEALLADPAARLASQIATEYPTAVGGRIGAAKATTVRLPELARSASPILAQGLVGRTLELLRASRRPAGVAATWGANPLTLPAAALPLGDGRTALVLDLGGLSGWTLREIDLATGAVLSDLATGPENLHAGLALEPDGASALVAVGGGGNWRVLRAALDGGGATELVSSADGVSVTGTVRGIACLGTDAAVVTAGDKLVHLTYAEGEPPSAVPALTGLAQPWGVVRDLALPGRLYVAENSAGDGRVLAVDLDAAGAVAVVAELVGSGDAGFTRPRGLALTPSGAQLLAVVDGDTGDGTRELRGVNLGGLEAGEAFDLTTGLPLLSNAVATGPDGLVVVPINDFLAPDLAVGGGLLQTRTISAYEPYTQTVTVEPPFEAVPGSDVEWRVSRALGPLVASPGGVSGLFVWDSADLPSGGDVVLRVLAMDTDVGSAAELGGSKEIRAPLDVDVRSFALPGSPALTRALAAADLDSDGDLDVVAANSGSNALVVLEQTGPGTFVEMAGSPLALGAGADPVAVATGDLDGDGRADIVAANRTADTLAIFFQTAGGFVADPNGPIDALGAGDGGPQDVVVADLDGDGSLDLAVANQSSGNVALHYNDGTGVFTEAPGTVGNANLIEPIALDVADLDGDGRLDLAVADHASDDLTIFFQKTAGSFMLDPNGPLFGPSTAGPRDVEAADVDGDGDVDLVLANQDSSDLDVFLQVMPGVFEPHPGGPLAHLATEGARSVVAADVTGDGRADLVSANQLASTLTVFCQAADGSFDATPLVLGDDTTTSSPVAVLAADLDGDGALDLAATHRSGSGDALAVFLQRGAGFMEADPGGPLDGSQTTMGPVAVEVGDVDGDGDQDLASINGNGTITLFYQGRPGAFAADLVNGPLALPFAGTPTTGLLADLDGDQDLDLAVATTGAARTLSLFYQVAPGQFLFDADGPIVLPGVNPQPVDLVAGDLDGDGDLDLAVANDGTDQVVLYFQGAPGEYAQSADPPLGGPLIVKDLISLAAGDLDGDGDLDLVGGSDGSDSLRVFFQTSPGSFAPGSPIPLVGSNPRPSEVAAADLDADGDLDLVCADISGALELFFQEPAGQFKSAGGDALGSGGGGDGPQSVIAVDLDRDGDLDLVSGVSYMDVDPTNDTVRVWRQASPGRFEIVAGQPGGGLSPKHPGALRAIDLDGDGDPDFVSANLLGNDLTIVYGSH